MDGRVGKWMVINVLVGKNINTDGWVDRTVKVVNNLGLSGPHGASKLYMSYSGET